MKYGRILLGVVGVVVLIPATALLVREDTDREMALVATGRTVEVSSGDQLTKAITDAKPGDRIRLADGEYAGEFVATVDGTPGQPITVSGSSQAVLRNPKGYGFHLKADNWRLEGFSVQKATKGVVLDGASQNLLSRLVVERTEEEAVRFRSGSSNNLLTGSTIRETGVSGGRAGFGEGVYVGSTLNDWSRYSGGRPDRSNRNRIVDNTFGPNVRGEAVDVMEGTLHGEIRGNRMNSAGQTGAHSDDSCLDLRGNGYLVYGNTCQQPKLDAFQTHIPVSGWGCRNVFRANTLHPTGAGLGVRIRLTGDGRNCGNVVYADNTAHGFTLTNIPTVKDG